MNLESLIALAALTLVVGVLVVDFFSNKYDH